MAGGARAIVVDEDMEVALLPPALARLPRVAPPGDGARVTGCETGGDHRSDCRLRGLLLWRWCKGSGSDSCSTRSWSASALAAAIVCFHLAEVASAETRKASESVMVARRATVAEEACLRVGDERCLLSPDADRGRAGCRSEPALLALERGGGSDEAGRERAIVARVSDAVRRNAFLLYACGAASVSGPSTRSAPSKRGARAPPALDVPGVPAPTGANRGTMRAGSHGEAVGAFALPPTCPEGSSITLALRGPERPPGLVVPEKDEAALGLWCAITDPSRDPVDGAAVVALAPVPVREAERALVADAEEVSEVIEGAALALRPRDLGGSSGITLLRRWRGLC